MNNLDRPAYVALVAAKMRERPAPVIARALKTLAHWRAIGQTNPHRLDAWEKLLQEASTGSEAGAQALLRAMEGDDPSSVRLRDFHPFHGLLTREERRAARSSCVYKH